jgi:CRP-like cAMP-binding protein
LHACRCLHALGILSGWLRDAQRHLAQSQTMSESKPVFVDALQGSFVFREGDAGSDMYIIESGTLEVLRGARGDVPVATLGPGDFFGEMAILEDQPRFASVRAVSAARLLRVDRAAFAGMLRENFEIAVRIMRKLVARLRRTEELLQSAQADLDILRRGGAIAAPEAPATVPLPVRAEPARVSASRKVAAIDPDRIGKPMKLVHMESGSEFALSASKPEMLIGRPDPVTGLLPEINLGPLDSQRSLSRRHAKIVNEGGLMFLREEVGTTNGTFINGERVATGEARPLALGDTLRFGSVELRVESL